MGAVKCGCMHALESQRTLWPSTHGPLTLVLSCKFRAFLPFLHGLSKPLTTYLCVVLCTSCWKPGSCWPPVKEDPLHHGSDTFTVPLSLSEEPPPPPPTPRHCTHSHTTAKPHTFLLWQWKDRHNDEEWTRLLSCLFTGASLRIYSPWALQIHSSWLSSHTPVARNKQLKSPFQ